MSLLWRKVYTQHEAIALKNTLVEALVAFELAFPVSQMDIKLHNVLHLVDKLIDVGPLYITSMFGYERTYKILKGYIHTKKCPEANVMKTFVKCQLCTHQMATGWSMVDGLSVFDIDSTDAVGEAIMEGSLFARYFSFLHVREIPISITNHYCLHAC